MNKAQEKRFSIVKRAKSFAHAGRGISVFIKSTHNAWVQIGVFAIAVFAGFYFNISNIEWALFIFASGLVFAVEAINTAIEIDMDLTSPEFHPYARDTKDVAAGASLIASLTALIIGILIFGKYIF